MSERGLLCNTALRVRAENRRVGLVDQGAQLQQVAFRLCLRPCVLFELLLQLSNALALFCNDSIGVCRIVAVGRGHRPWAAPGSTRLTVPVRLALEEGCFPHWKTTRIDACGQTNTLFLYQKWLKFTKLINFVEISKISHTTQNLDGDEDTGTCSPEFRRRKQHLQNSSFTVVLQKRLIASISCLHGKFWVELSLASLKGGSVMPIITTFGERSLHPLLGRTGQSQLCTDRSKAELWG